MILTGKEIIKETQQGNIQISPFQEDLVNPNSYNYRLASTLIKFCPDTIDAKADFCTEEFEIPEEGYVLEPGNLYLGATLEKIGSTKYVPSLIGRSSLGRLGLFLQITADLGHLGTYHSWTLELKVVQPLRVYAGMRIGQVSFWVPEGADLVDTYQNKQGHYANYSKPQPSIPKKLFE